MTEQQPSLSEEPVQRTAGRPVLGEALQGDRDAALRSFFHPLFAGMGGIDSWLGNDTPAEVLARLHTLNEAPLTKSQLCQLLILSHEAGLSDGFFKYYWLTLPPHTYDVRFPGNSDLSFDEEWLDDDTVRSLEHLKWGLYRFYVDALLYFGNVRSAYRSLRQKAFGELVDLFAAKRFDVENLRERGPALSLARIAKDDRYLVAEYACKSFESEDDEEGLEQAALRAYRARVEAGGSPVVSIEELLKDKFIEETFPGRQQQFTFSADDILREIVGSEKELRTKVRRLSQKFSKARGAALLNTRLYLSMVEELDVYVATSMRSRDHFRNMADFCSEVFERPSLKELNIRYFDPTLSAAEGHVDKGLIECLMVDAAKILVYYVGDRESLGKDFEAAMALSRGKTVIFYCDDAQRDQLYRFVHPLTRLIEFESGVAIGAMIANTTAAVGELIARVLENRMEYILTKTPRGALHLEEASTKSLIRLQTHDRLLQETFWNYYHRQGTLA